MPKRKAEKHKLDYALGNYGKVRRRRAQGETAAQAEQRRRDAQHRRVRQLLSMKVPAKRSATNPAHYHTGRHEHWDVMQQWLGTAGWVGYMLGCTTKYICRWKDKNGLEDLRKARTYLDKCIMVMERGPLERRGK